jgi:hypothetical protein
LLVACGGKSESITTGSGSDAGSARTTNALDDGDPAAGVVAKAFGKRRPSFPLLSKDGSHAVVEIATPIGMSGGSTYSVGFVAAGADEWSGAEIDLTTLVDAQLVHLLVDAREESTAPTYDIASITRAANDVADRIVNEGFRPFDSSFDAIVVGTPATIGPFRFTVTDEPTGTITIAVSEGSQAIGKQQIQPIPTGRVADVDCLAKPRVRRAFADTGRRRLLLQIGWNAGPPQCGTPDEKYRLFAGR